MKNLTAIRIAAILAIGGAAGVCAGTIIAPAYENESVATDKRPITTGHESESSYWDYLDKETTENTEETSVSEAKSNSISNTFPAVNSSCKERKFTDEEFYLLSKLVMAEAESETLTGQALVALVVLNRVESPDFPNSIYDVIFQDGQFTPIKDGRWDAVEPDDSCKAAVHFVETGCWDESQGATYFSTHETEWHRNNLKYLFEKGAHRFYK